MGAGQISIFDYFDYRKFLRDWYQQSRRNYGFSLRAFARRAGLKSQSTFKMVMDGHRNLGRQSVDKFIRGLRLNSDESLYFRHLVAFNHAKTHEQKNDYYQKILFSQQFRELRPIAKDQYEYYNTWYHPIIRELIVTKKCSGDLNWLVEKIKPRISLEQAEASIQLLCRLGLIKQVGTEEDPLWEQQEKWVTTGDECPGITIFNYHHSILDLVKQQITKVPSAYRDISALTLGVQRKHLGLLKQKLQAFREEILKLVSNDVDSEDVLLLAMQLLPLTDIDSPPEVL